MSENLSDRKSTINEYHSFLKLKKDLILSYSSDLRGNVKISSFKSMQLNIWKYHVDLLGNVNF